MGDRRTDRDGPFDLTDHVALVTGGNSGIGLGYAEGLAAAGADVAIWGTNEEKNAAAAEQLRGHGGTVVAVRCDVGDEAQVDDAVRRARWRRSAGSTPASPTPAPTGASPFVDMTLDDWRAVLRVNLDGVFLTFRAAARHMVERGGGGSLVGTGSLAVDRRAAPRRALRGEQGRGGHARQVARGRARPPRHPRQRGAAGLDRHRRSPRRSLHWDRFVDSGAAARAHAPLGPPDDFGAVAVYLASPASAYHTGDTLLIDGGYSLF